MPELTRLQFIDDLKDQYPFLLENDLKETEEEINKRIYRFGIRNFPDTNVEPWDKVTQKPEDIRPDYSPETIKSYGRPNKAAPGTFGLIDEDSHWIKRSAYANSLHGMGMDLLSGETTFSQESLADYDPEFWEEALAGVLSFVMPLDLLTIFTGGFGLAGKVGGTVARGTKVAKAGWATSSIDSLAKKGAELSIRKNLNHFANKEVMEHTLTRMTKEGITLGMYEGIKGNFGAQRDGENVFGGTMHGVVHGGLMGTVLGLTGGYLGGQNARLVRKLDVAKAKGNTHLIAKVEKALMQTGAASQYATEVGALTGFGTAEQFLTSDVPLTWETFGRDLLVNSAFVGLMKSKRFVMNETATAFKAARAEMAADKQDRIDKVVGDIGETITGMKNNIHENTKIPDATKEGIIESIKSAERDIFERLEKGQDTEVLDVLAGKLEVLSEIAERNPEQLIDLAPEIFKTIRASQAKLKEMTDVLPEHKADVRSKYQGLFDKLDGMMLDAEKAVKKKETAQESEIAQTKRTAKKLKIPLKKRDPVTKQMVDKSIAELNGEINSERDLIKLQAIRDGKGGVGEELESILEKRGIGSTVVEGKHLIGRTMDHFNKIIEGVRNFIKKPLGKKPDKEFPSEGTVKDLLGKIKEAGGTELDLLAVYKGAMKSGKFTEGTVEQYGKTVVKFYKWLGKKGISFTEVTEDNILEFYRETSKNGELPTNPEPPSPIRNLFKWAAKKGNLNLMDDPSEILLNIYKSYNDAVRDATFEMPSTTDWHSGNKEILKKLSASDSAVMKQAYVRWLLQSNTGLRVSEIYAKAEHEGISFNQIEKINGKWMLNLTGEQSKNRGQRYIPISNELYREINKYVKDNKMSDVRDLFKDANQTQVSNAINRYMKHQFNIPEITSDNARQFFQIAGHRGVDLSARQIRLLDYALGHNERLSRLDKIYLKGHNKEQIAKDVSEVYEAILGAKFQLGKAGEGISGFLGEYKTQVKFLKDKFPKLYEKFSESDELGEMNGRIILGKVVNHAISIATKHAKPDTLPHEIHHQVVDLLMQIGDANSKRLIKRGIKTFGSEELLIEALGKYSRGELAGKNVGKARNFVQKFWDSVRSFLGIESKEQIQQFLHERFMLGEKGLKKQFGKDFESIMDRTSLSFTMDLMPKFQLGKNVDWADPSQRKNLNKETKSLQISKKLDQKHLPGKKYAEQLNKDVTEAMGYEGKTKYNSLTKLSDIELETYYNFLLNKPGGKGGSGATHLQGRAQEWAVEQNIPYRHQVDLLKAVGVKDGEWSSATKEQINMFKAYAKDFYKGVDPIVTSQEQVETVAGENAPMMPNVFTTFLTPTYIVIKRVAQKMERMGKSGAAKALKNISQIFIDYDITHEKYQGVMRGLTTTMLSSLGKHKDLIAYIDTIHSRDKFTPEQKKFMESPEFKIAEKNWNQVSEIIWEGILQTVKPHLSEAKYEEFKKDMSAKKIADYMTRTVNPELLDAIHDGRWGSKVPALEKMFLENLKLAAEKDATDKKLKKGGTSWKAHVEEKMNDKSEGGFRDKIYDNLRNNFTFNPNTVDLDFLKNRKYDFEPEVEIKDVNGKKKIVESYIKTYDATVERYVLGGTKFITTLKYFPEWTKIGKEYGIKKAGADYGKVLVDANEMTVYIDTAIKRHLGLERDAAGTRKFYKKVSINDVTGGAANLSAATGLTSFFFTQAQKNIVLGTIRTYGTFGMENTLKAMWKSIDPEGYEKGLSEGWGEGGTKSIALEARNLPLFGQVFKNLTMEKVLTVSGMLGTERFNRVVAGHAGQMWWESALHAAKGQKNIFGKLQYRDLDRMQDEVFQFSDAEMKWVKDHSLSEIFSSENNGKLITLKNKVGHYAHETTQGGTTVAKLPLWMSNSLVKPWTLFVRIATSVTHDTYRNYMRPIFTHQNPLPLMRSFVASQLGGAALWGFYDWAFDREKPVSQSDSVWHHVMANAWRAEFLGLGTEILNPYKSPLYSQNDKSQIVTSEIMRGGGVTDLYLKRQVMATGKAVIGAIQNTVSGRETQVYKQLLKRWLTDTSVAINQLDGFLKHQGIYTSLDSKVLWNSKRGQFLADVKRIGTLERQFLSEKKFTEESFGKISKRAPYYVALKEAFWLGNEIDRAREYWKSYAYVTTDLISNEGYTAAGADSMAKSILKGIITRLNPLSISSSEKKRTVSRKSEFLQYLKPDMRAKAKQLEKQFYYNKRIFWADVLKRSWQLKYSVFFDEFKP